MQQAAAALAKPGFQRAAVNLAWLMGERAIRFVLGVVVGFLVARYLGPTELGKLSYCTAVVTLFGGLVALGLDSIVKRDLLQSPERTSQTLAAATALRIAAGCVAYLLLAGIAAMGAARSLEERRLILLVGTLLVQPALIVPDLWLQAGLRSKYSVMAQIFGLVVGAVTRVVLVATGAGLTAFGVVVVVEGLLAGIAMHLVAARAGLQVRWLRPRLAEMRRLLAESWPLMFASLAIIIYMKIDEVMLRQLTGPASVGVYSAATRLTEIWYFVPTALASSLLPALLRAREQGDAAYRKRLQQYYDVNAAVAYAVSVPMALASPWIVRAAYGPAFAASAPIVAVHVWSSVFVFIGVARGQWLVNERLQRFYLVVTLAGAAMNIVLNLLFIPRWGGLGAAAATVISQATAAWLSSYGTEATRDAGRMQTRALLVPILGWRYLAK